MKILIDINHPAHVHYFRNFIKRMEAKEHQFCVINRDNQMINQLLDFYGIKHTIRNKRPRKPGTIVSIINLIRMTIWCIWKSIIFHPDMYLGFASSACAITSWIFRKPCILMDDTEFNSSNHKIYIHFCSIVLTPFYFKKNLQVGNQIKQIRFNAYIEQLYLHSSLFKKKEDVLTELNIEPQKYVIVRYSAYDAHHDLIVRPLLEETKRRIVREISKYYPVLVSLEKGVRDPFYNDYLLKISPEKMHDLEANAKFLVTEGITMASESFVLGVPYLLINPLKCGYIDYQCSNYPNRSFYTTDEEEVMRIVRQLVESKIDSEAEKRKVEKLTINPTDFLIQFVENYPNINNVADIK